MLHSVLKPLLKRGVIVAAANWQVTLIQGAADSIFKLLLATPVVGGVLLVALVIGAEPRDLMSLEWREMVTTALGSLWSHPFVLLSFLLALAVVLAGGSFFVFLVKAGTVSVLVRGERQFGDIGQQQVHFDDLTRASAFTPELFIERARQLFPRFAALGVALMVVYAASAIGYLFVALAAGIFVDALGLAALITLCFVAWITLINLLYLLMQIVMSADDCGVLTALRRTIGFVTEAYRPVAGVFLTVLLLVVAATGVSFVATLALGLIGFVPFVGLAVVPLQLVAWLFRGLMFQFLGLSAVGAYLRLYREYAGMTSSTPAQSISAFGTVPGAPPGTQPLLSSRPADA